MLESGTNCKRVLIHKLVFGIIWTIIQSISLTYDKIIIANNSSNFIRWLRLDFQYHCLLRQPLLRLFRANITKGIYSLSSPIQRSPTVFSSDYHVDIDPNYLLVSRHDFNFKIFSVTIQITFQKSMHIKVLCRMVYSRKKLILSSCQSVTGVSLPFRV